MIIRVLYPIQIVFPESFITAFGSLQPPVRSVGNLKHQFLVVGNIRYRLEGRKMWMPVNVAPWNDRLLNMNGVLGKKPMAPVINRLPELRGSRFNFKQSPVKSEPEIAAFCRQRRVLRMPDRSDVSFLPKIAGIDPIVHAETQVGDLSLRITGEKSCEEHLL